MTRRVRVFKVDAFTREPFSGNPAGVVLDGEALGDAQMLAIARELNDGDTAFVLPADGTDHDLRVRFFTPRGEAGFVGHATVAAQAVLASLGIGNLRRQGQRTGIVDIGQQATAAGTEFSFTQALPALRGGVSAELLGQVLAALGLAAADLDARCPPSVGGAGSTRLLLAVRDGAVLAQLQPDLGRLAAISAAGAPAGYFLYTLRPSRPGGLTEARMFCPAIGIAEDPVSGNAHAMLGALLHRHGLLPDSGGGVEFIGTQGAHVGRPGSVRVTLAAAGGPDARVTIAGAAKIMLASTFDLPGSWA
jgi:PhzF family phenazine biosynthesis protein